MPFNIPGGIGSAAGVWRKAGRLHQDLVEHFGTSRVFMDVEGIAPSEDWRRRHRSSLDSAGPAE